MTFVVTNGQLAVLDRATAVAVSSVRVTDKLNLSYEDIWKTQPQVRTVVSFLARNIAQLKLHTYRRTSDTDRERLSQHPLAMLLTKPNPRTTRYRWFDALVNDLGIHDNAVWVKAKGDDGAPYGLLRLPPGQVTPVGDDWLWPEKYRFRGARGYRDFDPDQVVHFRGYNPGDARWGLSPLETLRRILAEEYESGNWREQLWRNGARVPGHIRRPKDAGPWSDQARERFVNSWKGLYTGDGPAAGGTPVLEDGMEFHTGGITPEQAQYLETRKLTREEVAAAFHIPLPMVGILDHATFSNIEEQHRNLYQDTLGPWLTMIAEEIMLQLLPDVDSSDDVYCEFNLQEKMRGDFETEATSLQTATGGPWMTRNEARARQNLPAIDGADELVLPMNVTTGGQASPTDSAPKQLGRGVMVKARAPEQYRDDHIDRAQKTLTRFFRRQKAAVLSALGAKSAGWWDENRWNTELADDLFGLSLDVTQVVGLNVAASFESDYDDSRTEKFLRAVADSRAGAINSTTRDQVQAALDSADEDATPDGVFDSAIGRRAPAAALTLVTTLTAFATTEAAKQAGGDKATKTWIVRSSSPRSAHVRMNGETVGINEKFSNGAEWPGDPVLGADGVAGCKCDVEVNVP